MGWGGCAAPPLCLSPWFSLLPLLQGDAAQLSDPLLFLSLTRSLLFPPKSSVPTSWLSLLSKPHCAGQPVPSFISWALPQSVIFTARKGNTMGGFRDLSKVTVHRKDLNLIQPTPLQLSIVVSSPASPWFLQSSVS